ncbi:MAG: hypothetical protein A2161_11460 [Candidatus Schekmanbacteria bacterium RBG_13_48_7]|uniref:Glycosyltransferase 2-like domain-containing protein n=1 Tax=Candidatus Schekmanbacteria bacterium RBG_13_48_7 TaxID=1817878 RepID=A0A1F7RX33_9BACT|nr:MAG: hypothetical protein A2161_11460 [Candidatus Schekmanbacteria bacterium RBG_13_48_7]
MHFGPRIAVVIPCLNEEKSIGKVVRDFRKELPDAEIVVFDNNSNDLTSFAAREAGANVFYEKRTGKGFAVRAMFNKVDADIYIMVDGDDTYPADEVHKLLKPVLEGRADIVVGNRLTNASNEALNPLHKLGNKIILSLLNFCFKQNLQDILSGYRIMTEEFVNNIFITTSGFEVETELTIQALERRFRILELPISYRPRQEGTKSKIKTWQDGFKIIMTIFMLLRDHRPMTFFPGMALLVFILGLFPGYLVIIDYARSGIVTRLPLALFSTGLMIIAMICFFTGFLVSTINYRFRELDVRLTKIRRKIKEAA